MALFQPQVNLPCMDRWCHRCLHSCEYIRMSDLIKKKHLSYDSILMFGSGLPTAEKPTAKRFFLLSNGRDTQYASAWKHYQEYLQNTSILIPIPPSIYGPLPRIIKRTILMDFPMYSFSEEKDGEVALHEAQEDE